MTRKTRILVDCSRAASWSGEALRASPKFQSGDLETRVSALSAGRNSRRSLVLRSSARIAGAGVGLLNGNFRVAVDCKSAPMQRDAATAMLSNRHSTIHSSDPAGDDGRSVLCRRRNITFGSGVRCFGSSIECRRVRPHSDSSCWDWLCFGRMQMLRMVPPAGRM